MDNSEVVMVCHATAFATTFAIRVERALDSGLGSFEELKLDHFAEEAQAVADEAAKRYARVLNPKISHAKDHT